MESKYAGKQANMIWIDEVESSYPADWYVDPADQMLVYMGLPPSPGALVEPPEWFIKQWRVGR